MRAPFTPNSAHRQLPFILLVAVSVSFVLAGPLRSKEITLTAIELYPGPDGQAYVQITSVLINDKTELRLCGPSSPISKSLYGKLTKVVPSAGDSLEYGNDGVLALTKDGNSSCVVPSNVKFEKTAPLTPAEFATRAILQARVLSSDSSTALPPLKPGVKLVFVPAADVELAEYLRADRASTVPLWQNYLARYPATSHAARAKESLAVLLVRDGETRLSLYTKAATSSPSYEGLKDAKLCADQALLVVPNFAPAAKLNDEVHVELEKVVAQGRAGMDAYKKALDASSPGYIHLATAAELAKTAIRIDPEFPSAKDLYAETMNESNA